MISLESIYEIKEAVLNLQKYLASKDPVVLKKARVKYAQLVDIFFLGANSVGATKQRQDALNDQDYFMKLMDEAVEYYYFGLEG